MAFLLKNYVLADKICLGCARGLRNSALPVSKDILSSSHELWRNQMGQMKFSYKKLGPAEIWTRIAGFRVQSANHYTTGPIWKEGD